MQNPEFVKFGNPIELNNREYAKLSKFIYDNYGINLPITKKTLLESRLQKHLRVSGIPNFKKYIEKVCSGEEHEEVVNMINIVSTNKTDFFREKPHFDYMNSTILPTITNRPKSSEIKIWSAAASSGEEIYTIGMTMEEYFKQRGSSHPYSVIGTDISTDMLKKGRDAIYHEDRIAALPIELKKEYFLRSKNRLDKRVRVIKKLRDRASFRRFNLMDNKYPAHESFDIIFCRNVLIYFDKPTQEKVVRKLCNSLRTGGYLFLGHSESIFGMQLPLKQRLHTGYQKIR